MDSYVQVRPATTQGANKRVLVTVVKQQAAHNIARLEENVFPSPLYIYTLGGLLHHCTLT